MTRSIASVLVILALAAPAAAAPQDVANDISRNIMSPYCPGVTLHDCPSDSAVALRDRITGWAEDGFTRAQIMDRLITEYGDTIRAEPPRSGSGLVAWLLPVLAALLAAGVAWKLLRRWAHGPEPVDGYDPDIHVTPADRRRLDAELDKLRGPA
jgi:cytochrome c-type biogenesis protein CcmH/NrfF